MEKYIYIKKSIAKHYVDFAEPLKAEEYSNLGETWQDYIDDKWVLLSDEQVAFHEANPNASIKEVFDMAIAPAYVPTVEDVKRSKLRAIEEYDKSENVNSFTIGGQQMWLSVDERQQLATQISANEAIGRDSMTRWFNGAEFTFPINTWKQMLMALEIYAGDALNVTESHKAAVKALTTKEEVEAYDITANYPTKLVF